MNNIQEPEGGSCVWLCVCGIWHGQCHCVIYIPEAPAVFLSAGMNLRVEMSLCKIKPGTKCSLMCVSGESSVCVFMFSVSLCAGILSMWKHIAKCLILPQSCQCRNALQTVHAQCSHTRKLSQKMTEDQIWSDMLRKHLFCTEMNRKRKKERKVANGKSCINVDFSL